MSNADRSLQRREFLKQTGLAAGAGFTQLGRAAQEMPVVILIDPSDAVASAGPAKWAAGQLTKALEAKKASARIAERPAADAEAALYVIAAGPTSQLARAALGESVSLPHAAEGLKLAPGRLRSKPATVAAGADVRGLVYALLELADRVNYGTDLVAALKITEAIDEVPANEVRSISRSFVSEAEDKTWYYDKDFWRSYLDTLASQRFNRFNLAYGIGWDFPRNVTGDYFHFAYPYLLDVPGYDVRVLPLAKGERERNLEALRFISDETAARGISFQVGIWTHAYQWTDSPHAAHHVEGLNSTNHAAYCRDALHLLLQSCPSIEGVTFRIHGESGIPEGSYDLWQEIFQGIVRTGRRIEIDMHAKGMDEKMIEVAVGTGMPVKISPKFWAEHMGLGYHQAAIRELEMPPKNQKDPGFFALSEGARKFLRYGYGDLYQKDRKYGILFRMWPGTQRVLLWGDPAMASAYGRTSHFCGASGVELFEPMFFKGRKGSGLPGGRCAYADESLSPRFDFEKYQYTYRIWGQHLYTPNARPETWRRYLNAKAGAAAPHLERALANSSRVLPLLTTAHLVSASNNSFWPEVYTNMPIVENSVPAPFRDTPEPRRFGTVSPLDPQLFSTIEQHAAELLKGEQTGKYSPVEVASWFETFTSTSTEAVAAAQSKVPAPRSVDFRRAIADVAIQNGLGEFFAAKLRSGVLYAIFQQSGDGAALQSAVEQYEKAVASFRSLANSAEKVYRSDITYGPGRYQRGHWLDRIPAIEADLAAMQALLQKQAASTSHPKAAKAVQLALSRPARPAISCRHTPPKSFQAGESVTLAVTPQVRGERVASGRLHYRRVDQSEEWQSCDLEPAGQVFRATIPGAYTKSPFHLQYYFELRQGPASVGLHPGFTADLANQPYFVIEQA